MRRLLLIGLFCALTLVSSAAAAPRPPSITVPPDMTVEAQSFAGAQVTYTASAVDSDGDPIPVTCTPQSGSTFAIGPTVVTCTARANGQTSSKSFTITVVDTTPPTVTVPSSAVARTTGTSALVRWTASATDRVDGAVTPTCTPASGSRFPVGTTQVTCTATDVRGNSASATFPVQVVHVRVARRTALLAPLDGAVVTAPPLLMWKRVARASLYNVQLYRSGRKILSSWPTRARFRLQRSWKYSGRTFRLKPGVYTWYVWPGFGRVASPRYGKLLGKSSFRVR